MTRHFLAAALLCLVAAPALPQGADTGGIGKSASINVGSGPHKGKYAFAAAQACVIAPFGGSPAGVSVVFASPEASLSFDLPNIDPKHASELQVVLIVADVTNAPGGMTTASVTYEIDTRPDTVLQPFQKAERANKGMSGKATTTLMQQGANVLVSFSGETATGVKLSGELTCRKMP